MHKYYVVAPFAASTGGVELAHQLVDCLRELKQCAYIVYVDSKCNIVENGVVTEFYRNYNIEVSSCIEDSSGNMLILPEIYFDFIFEYNEINIGCWWMSVDNRYLRCSFLQTFNFSKGLISKLKVIKRFLVGKEEFARNDNNILKSFGDRIIHFYQSAYAQYHLYDQGFSRVLPLSDYINSSFLNNRDERRENVVLYNPKKGAAFTNCLIKQMPNLRFIPLIGYNRNELTELMKCAKLYIDFGSFPGKDRLPREAVLNGCCILTGKNGASAFYEDVAIPQYYKIETKLKNISLIESKIRYIINNFNECQKDMDIYRFRILKEQNLFKNEVKNLVELLK